ncbi:hypothetical protein P3T25_005200 [Paraburkholderia sp. GAS32]
MTGLLFGDFATGNEKPTLFRVWAFRFEAKGQSVNALLAALAGQSGDHRNPLSGTPKPLYLLRLLRLPSFSAASMSTAILSSAAPTECRLCSFW